ncbi:MAG: HD domain-containing protein [Thermoplasmata archaeon]|nr:HD domain-containing protein [Thermoplasmata archaeon]
MDLLYMFFDATNMHRWNDHIRPLDLTELDKQSHKAAIAWVLGKSWESTTGESIDWRRLIEHSVFSLIERCVMTDIKPPLFHRIKVEKASEMADFVMSEVHRIVPRLDLDFAKRLDSYLRSKNDTREDELLRAAHYMATHWEFNLVYDMNRHMVGIDHTRNDIEAEIDHHDTVIANMRAVMGNDNFIDLIGQLRFQQRWTRTPRIPVTTVLGHSLLVANAVFLNDLDKGADDRMLYNDYYAALFHDLPEVLTKDVITPVKMNVGGLSELLESYEEEMVESKLMPMIPESWREEFRFILYDPFSDKKDERFGELMGRDIKAADLIAAYMEARLSRYYGVSSRVLRDAEASSLKRLSRYMTTMDVNGLLQDLEKLCE